MSNTTYITEQDAANAAWEAGNEWVRTSDRHEMLDFLTENASPEFRDTMLTEMVNYMGDKDFAEFFNHLRRNWGILTPQELDHRMNS